MAKKGDGELQVPPQNLEAEQAVLGAILMDAKALDRVMPLLAPNAFYKEAHNRIYAAMLELQNVGDPVDTVTLTNKLAKDGILEQVGGAYYITGLVDALPSAANVENYALIVREKHVLREVVETGNELVAAAYKGELEPDELLDGAEHKLFDLQRRAGGAKVVSIEPILHDSLTKLDKQHHDRKHGYTGLPSGFPDLDDRTDGFQPSDLVILSGRPSMVKTAFALGIARNTAKMYGHKVGF
ncbi:MAG: replicative DNA helicase, partial [Fidelibacterota bacterium]